MTIDHLRTAIAEQVPRLQSWEVDGLAKKLESAGLLRQNYNEVVGKIEMELDETASQIRAFAGDFQDGSEDQDTLEGWADILDHPYSRVKALLGCLKDPT